MELDFSKLEDISYRGFAGMEAKEKKDSLIAQGYTVLDGEITPFKAGVEQKSSIYTPSPASPSKRARTPLTSMDEKRNYRAMYRAACDFHETHNPPVVDGEYWRSHQFGMDDTPQTEVEYWEKAAEDMSAVASAFQQDPFLIGLLVAIFEELEREYIDKRQIGLAKN